MHTGAQPESENRTYLDRDIICLVQKGAQTGQTVAKMRAEAETLIARQRRAGKPVLLLADLTQVPHTDSGARLEAKAFLDDDFDALAVAGNAYLQPIIMYVLKITGKQHKVHYFSNIDAARSWLQAPHERRRTARPTFLKLSFFQIGSVAILVMVILASALSWHQETQRLKDSSLQNLQSQAFKTQSVIQSRIQAYTDTLRGFRGFFHSSQSVSEGEFSKYYHSLNLDHDYPGFNDISYVTWVRAADKESFVVRMRRDTSLYPQGNPGFAITPSGERSEYYAITYFAKATGGKGLDLRTNEERRVVLEAARDSGQPTATGSLNLLTPTGQSQSKRGFLLTMPVYQAALPATVAARQQSLTGFIDAVFDYQVLFGDVLRDNLPPELHLRLFDTVGNVIYESGAQIDSRGGETVSHELVVAGQKWRLEMTGSATFGLGASESELPTLIWVAGAVVSSLLAILLGLQLRTHRRTVALAEAMTKDLRYERNSAVATKNKDEAILASIGDGVVALDTKGAIILLNKAAERITGVTAKEAVGKPYQEVLQFLDEHSKSARHEFIATAQAGHQSEEAAHTVIAQKIGSFLPVANSAAPIFDANGIQQGVIVVFRDISTERQAQARLSQLAAIVESSDDAIISTDFDGVIASWNLGAERLYGYSAREAIGRTQAFLMHKVHAQEVDDIMQKVNHGKRFTRLETTHLTKDGREIEVSVAVSPLTDELGRVVGASSITRDITQEKQFERAIKESNERFELVAKATSEVVYDLNLVANTLWWNDSLYSQYGFPRDEAAATVQWRTAHIHPEDVQRVTEDFTNFLEGEALTWTIEYRFKKADDTYIFVRDRAFMQRNSKGDAIRMVGSLLDVTKQKELDRAKDEFISLVSHQLRTPLTAIRLFTEMLTTGQTGKLTDEQQDYIEKIDISTKRMIQLVGDILNISRIEMGRLKIEPKPTDIVSLIQSHIDEVQPLADEKGVALHFESDKDLGELVIDPILFGQVVHNLLTNAIRYSRSESGEVRIKFAKIKAGYELQVTDNGIGIPPAAYPHIFGRFFRADNAIRAEGEGTGLGLYLINMILQQAGGTIRFESEEGKGTTFFVGLPKSGMKTKEGDKSLNK